MKKHPKNAEGKNRSRPESWPSCIRLLAQELRAGQQQPGLPGSGTRGDSMPATQAVAGRGDPSLEAVAGRSSGRREDRVFLPTSPSENQ